MPHYSHSGQAFHCQSVFLWNLYLLDQQHPRPFYGLCYCNRSLAPQYLMYFILSTVQFYSPYFYRKKQRYSGIREVCLHYLIYQCDYCVVAEVPRASQEIHHTAGSMNAPRSLEIYIQTPLPCPPHGVRLFVLQC